MENMEGATIPRARGIRIQFTKIHRIACDSRVNVTQLIAAILLIMLAFHITINDSANTLLESYKMEKSTISDDALFHITFHTKSNPTKYLVKSGDRISGDHVILTAKWYGLSSVDKTRIEVNASAIPSFLWKENNSVSVEIDTRYLGNNGTCIINATVYLTEGTSVNKVISNVYIGNFFMPQVEVLSPNGGEMWIGMKNITWSANDTNKDEILSFDVLLSSDSGRTFTPLGLSLNRTWFELDCDSLPYHASYRIMVSVTDGIFFSSDISDADFTAGSTTITSTSTTTITTTTTTTTGIDLLIIIFVILFAISAAAMAVIVYIAAKKWF